MPVGRKFVIAVCIEGCWGKSAKERLRGDVAVRLQCAVLIREGPTCLFCLYGSTERPLSRCSFSVLRSQMEQHGLDFLDMEQRSDCLSLGCAHVQRAGFRAYVMHPEASRMLCAL